MRAAIFMCFIFFVFIAAAVYLDRYELRQSSGYERITCYSGGKAYYTEVGHVTSMAGAWRVKVAGKDKYHYISGDCLVNP